MDPEIRNRGLCVHFGIHLGHPETPCILYIYIYICIYTYIFINNYIYIYISLSLSNSQVCIIMSSSKLLSAGWCEEKIRPGSGSLPMA